MTDLPMAYRLDSPACPFCGDELSIERWTRSKSKTLAWRLLCMSNTDCFFMDFDTEEEAVEMAGRRFNPQQKAKP